MTPDRAGAGPRFGYVTPYIKPFLTMPLSHSVLHWRRKEKCADTVTGIGAVAGLTSGRLSGREEVVALLENASAANTVLKIRRTYERRSKTPTSVLDWKTKPLTRHNTWLGVRSEKIMRALPYDDRPTPRSCPAPRLPRQETKRRRPRYISPESLPDDLVYYAGQQKERKSFSGWKTFLLEEVSERPWRSFCRRGAYSVMQDLSTWKVYDDQETFVFRYLVMERLQTLPERMRPGGYRSFR